MLRMTQLDGENDTTFVLLAVNRRESYEALY